MTGGAGNRTQASLWLCHSSAPPSHCRASYPLLRSKPPQTPLLQSSAAAAHGFSGQACGQGWVGLLFCAACWVTRLASFRWDGLRRSREDITQVSRTSLCLLWPLSLQIVSPLVHCRSLNFFTTNCGSCLPLVKAGKQKLAGLLIQCAFCALWIKASDRTAGIVGKGSRPHLLMSKNACTSRKEWMVAIFRGESRPRLTNRCSVLSQFLWGS